MKTLGPTATGLKPPRLLVHLRPVTYCLVHLALVLLRLACVAFFVFTAWLYDEVSRTNLANSLTAFNLVLSLKYFPFFRLLHVGFALLFAFSTLLRVWQWLRRRVCPRRRKVVPHEGNQIGRRLQTTIESAYERVYGRRGLCGVEDSWFDLIFLGREIIELVLQTIQAAHMSRLVSRPSFNHFYICVIVANCWLTPLLHHLLQHRPGLQRLSCVVCDLALDFITVVRTPVYLFSVYYRDFDSTLLDFPYSLWYYDRWQINLLNEVQLIFLSSWGDVFSRVFFSMSLLGSIRSIHRLISLQDASITGHTLSIQPEAFLEQREARISRLTARANRVMLPCIALWGLGVLSVHLHASRLPSSSSCDVAVHPWFVSKPACSLMIINCHSLQIQGNKDELDKTLGQVDEHSLAYIVLRHCPQMEMPPLLDQFPALVGLKMFNCTIPEWTKDAALTASAHPRIRFLYLVRVNFQDSILPDGMTDTQFPQTLVDIELCVTNLKELPDDLHEKWPSGGYIDLEASNLDRFPPTLTKMSFLALSLAGNTITTIPSSIFEDDGAFSLSFRGNPITSLLNDVVYNAGRFTRVSLEYSSLSVIPVRMEAH
ncbi:hypothetical protein Poli38472_001984 [Pythium oligandrum]|uniref:Uncharacterized protein n=1 Tax=Pythium oligandrum TaxID=41045 RepID=A0A8K1CVR4_PYTOL|nr:hypothetical protein Poli38472_001984 [Pythium oligandrum]|eukprot:TMW69828.1 hypothetical protein Poli38472_001984 [Pythium oligandrum]